MPFRFGVIGAGGAAALHVPAMRTLPEIEVVAIADIDESRAAAFARHHRIPEAYGSTETLLAKASVDAVASLSPHHLHFGRTATLVHHIEVEDLAVGGLEYGPNCLAVVQTTTAAVPGQPSQLEIHGERGTAATFDNQGQVLFWASTLDAPASLPDRWRTYASANRGQESGSYDQAVLAPTRKISRTSSQQFRGPDAPGGRDRNKQGHARDRWPVRVQRVRNLGESLAWRRQRGPRSVDAWNEFIVAPALTSVMTRIPPVLLARYVESEGSPQRC